MSYHSHADRPAVIVIGGGSVGILVALALDRQGVDVVVIEQHALAGGQTAHAHGWLHHGHIFGNITQAESASLLAGARRWRQLAAHHGVPYLSEDNTIAFTDAAEAQAAMQHWREQGMEEPREVAEPGLPGQLAFRTGESALVPVDVLRAAATGSGMRILSGRALRIVDGDSTPGVDVETGSGRRVLRADRVVAAAGAGLWPLLGAPSTLDLRETFMLVVETSVEMPTAFAFPEEKALGLFGVRRTQGGRSLYLISGFLSSRPTVDGGREAEDMWRRATVPVLARFLPAVWSDPNARWGIYPAAKLEVARDVPLGVPGAAVIPTAYGSVLAVAPGKLTLAPLVADQVVATLAGVRRGGIAPVRDAVPIQSARWSSEDWTLTPLLRRDTLFRKTP